LIIATFVLNGICITLWALMFTWFGQKGCTTNQALISITIVAVVALNFVSIYVEHGSIFVTAIVSCYGSYLCYSGLQSNPDTDCNSYDGKNTLNLWLGILITAAALSYAGFSVSNTTNQAIKETKEEDKPAVELETKKEETDKEETDGDVGVSNYDDIEDEPKKKSKKRLSGEQLSEADIAERRHNVIFHICMAFAAIYISMLYTNWATDTGNESSASGRGKVSLGVNVGAEWLSFVAYLWTLIAPLLCSNREFS
jgi:hypothetical protein